VTTARQVDGRLARSQRTRAAVIDALVVLCLEGDPSPTALRVAERAGVALRTVYGHFADMESLYAEAGGRELALVAGMVHPVDPEAPLQVRLSQFAADRAAVLEHLLPLMRAAVMRAPGSPQLRSLRSRFLELGDGQVLAAFEPETDGLSDAQRRQALDVAHLVAGGNAWEALRLDRALGEGQARAVMERTLAAALLPLLARDVQLSASP
jgi:TetR/AcrR family transcriptional regulator of autoinduction and epiphytic fitness